MDIHLMPTQMRIYSYMKEHGSITGYEAVVECGVCDYRKRISEMRQAGIPISDIYVDTENRYGEPVRVKRYFLA